LLSSFSDRELRDLSFPFLAPTTGGAIALPSDRTAATPSVFMSSGAGLPTTFVGEWHKPAGFFSFHFHKVNTRRQAKKIS